MPPPATCGRSCGDLCSQGQEARSSSFPLESRASFLPSTPPQSHNAPEPTGPVLSPRGRSGGAACRRRGPSPSGFSVTSSCRGPGIPPPHPLAGTSGCIIHQLPTCGFGSALHPSSALSGVLGFHALSRPHSHGSWVDGVWWRSRPFCQSVLLQVPIWQSLPGIPSCVPSGCPLSFPLWRCRGSSSGRATAPSGSCSPCALQGRSFKQVHILCPANNGCTGSPGALLGGRFKQVHILCPAYNVCTGSPCTRPGGGSVFFPSRSPCAWLP